MSSEHAAVAVHFDHLGKTYQSAGRDIPALADIDLQIKQGEIFGIIGRSGAGKSSLLRTINRLESPSTGRVLIGGQNIADLNESGLVELRRRVGMVFQHFNLLSAKTVRDNIGLPLLVAGVNKTEIATRADEMLRLVGLEGKGDTYPSRLSGGQKQRVGIARALITRPDILLCDEATSALDPETTLSILNLLRSIHAQLGLTIVLITHEMSVIREICHRVVVLEGGRIAEEGPVWQVFGAPRHPATLALLRPLEAALPPSMADALHDTAAPGDLTVVELRFDGRFTPQLDAITAAIPGLQLIGATLEQIQGHPVGQLILTLPQGADPAAFATLASSTKVIGYVAAND